MSCARSSLAAVLLAVTLPAAALESDRRQPVDLTADHFEGVIADQGDSTLRGVQITQGSLRIVAEQAVISRRAGALERAVLNGQPATVRQRLDQGGEMQAEARQIDYDMAANVLILTGQVVITQPEGELRGERVRYEIGSGRIEGGAPGSRVQMRLPPAPAAGD